MVYLAIATLIGGRNLRTFLGSIREVALLAFSTSSSAAVMPLSLSTAEQKLHVRTSVARFIIPLGTTINMGGTALYQGVATLFLAQVFQVDIGILGMLLVVIRITSYNVCYTKLLRIPERVQSVLNSALCEQQPTERR